MICCSISGTHYTLLEPVAILVLPVPLDGKLLAVLGILPAVCHVFGLVKELSN